MRKHWAWIFPAVVAVGIFWLSSRSRLPFGVALPHPLDKLAHASAFAAFAGALDFALVRSVSRLAGWRRLAVVVLATCLFGATDEWHQSFVPGRACETGDWAADSLGGLVGAALQGLPRSPFRRRGRTGGPR